MSAAVLTAVANMIGGSASSASSSSNIASNTQDGQGATEQVNSQHVVGSVAWNCFVSQTILMVLLSGTLQLPVVDFLHYVRIRIHDG